MTKVNKKEFAAALKLVLIHAKLGDPKAVELMANIKTLLEENGVPAEELEFFSDDISGSEKEKSQSAANTMALTE